jgi:hypothetical protein
MTLGPPSLRLRHRSKVNLEMPVSAATVSVRPRHLDFDLMDG